MIEHNLDVIKTADWLVDLGPEGGSGGGQIIAQGTPEQVAGEKGSHTGTFLKKCFSDPILINSVRRHAGADRRTLAGCNLHKALGVMAQP